MTYKCEDCDYEGSQAKLMQTCIDTIELTGDTFDDYEIVEEGKGYPEEVVCFGCHNQID